MRVELFLLYICFFLTSAFSTNLTGNCSSSDTPSNSSSEIIQNDIENEVDQFDLSKGSDEMYSLKKVLLMHLLLNDSMQNAEPASEEINPQTEKYVQNDTEQVANQNEEPELSEPSLQDIKINETDPILLETPKALLDEQQESSRTMQDDIKPTELPKKTEATTIKAELIFFQKPLDSKALQDENQKVSETKQVKIEPTGLATTVATTNKTEQIILEKPKDSKTILDEQQNVSDSKRGEIKSSDLPLVETTNQTEPITVEQPKALKAIQNEQSVVVETRQEETKPTELPKKDETPNITEAISSATQKESTSKQNEQQRGLETKQKETKPTQKVETPNETEPIIFKKPKDLYQEEIKNTTELPKQVEITIKQKQILLLMPKVAIQDKQKIVSETKQNEIKPTELPRKIKTTNKLENIQVKITKDLKATGRKQDETRLSEPDKKVQTGKLKQEEQPKLLKTEQNEIKQKDIPKTVAGTKGPALIQVEKPNYSKPNMMDFLKLYNIRRMKQQEQISLGKPKDFEALQASQLKVIGTTKEEIKPSEVTKQFKTKAEPEPILLTKTNDSETIPDKQLNISKTKQEEIEPREGNRINYFYNETKKQKQNPIERFKRPQKPETIMKVINEIKMLKYRT